MLFPKDKSKWSEYFQLAALYQLECERKYQLLVDAFNQSIIRDVIFHRNNAPISTYLPIIKEDLIPQIWDRVEIYEEHIFIKSNLSHLISIILNPEISNVKSRLF